MQTKLRHKEELEGGYKAFTLVELIVVITILAIL
jgi:prepilin-type N-terminal cleavage/methylation domain-containing protein